MSGAEGARLGSDDGASRLFRDACGRYATGVAVVTCQPAEGEPVGITVNSFTSVSLDPPLVLFCIDRTAQSLPGFLAADRFAVHVLAADQRALSVRFASPGAAKFNGIDWSAGSCGPVLPDTLARFDCVRHAVQDGGDHLILLGRVDSIALSPTRPPLLYAAGRYASLAAD